MTSYKPRSYKPARGMTYVELIVVLGIFSIMLSISLFNYKKFQDKVTIKSLANDIALQVVEAQKYSVSGKWNSSATFDWKPSYGVSFNTSTPTKFVYFADLNNSSTCSDPGCIAPSYSIGGEVIDVINITRGNSIPISGLEVFGTGCPVTVTNLSIVFKRPNSDAIISSNPALSCSVSYVAVNITSPQSVNAKIKIYPSGRIQVN